jgi:spore coat protein U-like protein
MNSLRTHPTHYWLQTKGYNMKTTIGTIFAFTLCAGMAQAETATTQMSVSATITNTCSVTADPLNFTFNDPTAVDQGYALAQVFVSCTDQQAQFDLVVGSGNHYNGEFYMANAAGDLLRYELNHMVNARLYSGHSIAFEPWGAGTWRAGIDAYTFRNGAAPGNYTDSVTLTVTYNI